MIANYLKRLIEISEGSYKKGTDGHTTLMYFRKNDPHKLSSHEKVISYNTKTGTFSVTTKKATATKATATKIKKFSVKTESFLGAEISDEFYNNEITASEKKVIAKMNQQREKLKNQKNG